MFNDKVEAKNAADFAKKIYEQWTKEPKDGEGLHKALMEYRDGKTLAIQPGHIKRGGWERRYADLLAYHVCVPIMEADTVTFPDAEEIKKLPELFQKKFQKLFGKTDVSAKDKAQADGELPQGAPAPGNAEDAIGMTASPQAESAQENAGKPLTVVKLARCVYEYIQLMVQFNTAVALYGTLSAEASDEAPANWHKTCETAVEERKPTADRFTLDVFDHKLSWLERCIYAAQQICMRPPTGKSEAEDSVKLRIPESLIEKHWNNPTQVALITYLYHSYRDKMQADFDAPSAAKRSRFYPLTVQKGALGMYITDTIDLTKSLAKAASDSAGDLYRRDIVVKAKDTRWHFALGREAFEAYNAVWKEQPTDELLEITEEENPCALRDALIAYYEGVKERIAEMNEELRQWREKWETAVHQSGSDRIQWEDSEASRLAPVLLVVAAQKVRKAEDKGTAVTGDTELHCTPNELAKAARSIPWFDKEKLSAIRKQHRAVTHISFIMKDVGKEPDKKQIKWVNFYVADTVSGENAL